MADHILSSSISASASASENVTVPSSLSAVDVPGYHYQNVLFICAVFVLCGIAIVAGCVILLFFMDDDDDGNQNPNQNTIDIEAAYGVPLSSPPSKRREMTMTMTKTKTSNATSSNVNARKVDERYTSDERSALLLHAKRVWDRELAFVTPGAALAGSDVEEGRVDGYKTDVYKVDGYRRGVRGVGVGEKWKGGRKVKVVGEWVERGRGRVRRGDMVGYGTGDGFGKGEGILVHERSLLLGGA